MTRATLMPPPPGSRRCEVPRSLVTGTIRSTEVDRSTAGLGVTVTMSVMSAVPRIGRGARCLGVGLEPDEADVRGHDDAGRDFAEIDLVAALALELRAEFGRREMGRKAGHDAAGNEH